MWTPVLVSTFELLSKALIRYLDVLRSNFLWLETLGPHHGPWYLTLLSASSFPVLCWSFIICLRVKIRNRAVLTCSFAPRLSSLPFNYPNRVSFDIFLFNKAASRPLSPGARPSFAMLSSDAEAALVLTAGGFRVSWRLRWIKGGGLAGFSVAIRFFLSNWPATKPFDVPVIDFLW